MNYFEKHRMSIRIVARGIVVLVGLLTPLISAQNLKIYHIDVEQGDATLFVSPNGQTLLIDSGRNGHGSRIKDVMQLAGVTRIDHFVCTHYHADHYGGIDELANDEAIEIEKVYDRGDKAFLPQDKITGDRFIEYQEAVGNRAVHLSRGKTIPLSPDMAVTCIAAGGVVLSEMEPISGVDENDMSIALLIQFGGFRYLIGGDIEHTTEKKIADRDLVLDVDVYEANHHGSDTSSSSAFMQDLSPATIVISNGNHGGYKHPRQQTITLYESLNPQPTVFQTNKYLKGGDGGNVADEFIADLESIDTDGTILIVVDETATSYTVNYQNKSHTFKIKPRATLTSIVIESLLPRPVGPDSKLEEVTLRNNSDTHVSMAGCFLKDASGRVWALVSLDTIGPGQSVTIQRNGMPMSLNDSGDEITLLGPSNQSLDQFIYTESEEGVYIQTDN